MKTKVALVIVVVIALIEGIVIMNGNDSEDVKQNRYVIDYDEIEEIGYDSVPWDDDMGDFTDKIIISPETAIKIGELILTNGNPNKLNDVPNREVKKIINSDIYVVSYYNKDMLGGDYSMAINRKTGEVLKAWAGE